MNLAELQAELRHFAAERDWQPFHTPKNLSTALMVEAAELAEIFQWMTPDESRLAHQDVGSKERIGEEVADVLLYLLQVADHSEIDLAQAVKSKLARNALKYPAKQAIARVSPVRASAPGMHVLAVCLRQGGLRHTLRHRPQADLGALRSCLPCVNHAGYSAPQASRPPPRNHRRSPSPV